MDKNKIDISNRWAIGKRDSVFVILIPPRILTEEDALVFAAYLVGMVGDEKKWRIIYDAVTEQ